MGQLWNNVEAKGRKENGTWNKDPEGRTVGTVPLFSTTASWMATIYIYLMADHTGWEEGERECWRGKKKRTLLASGSLRKREEEEENVASSFRFHFPPVYFPPLLPLLLLPHSALQNPDSRLWPYTYISGVAFPVCRRSQRFPPHIK